MAKILPLLGFILLIPSILLNIYFLQNRPPSNNHKVLRVIDGDTFETTDHKTIRLLGVAAPEIDSCGGTQAKKELEKLITNKTITYAAPTVDVYSRLIADVYLPDKSSVNVAMIKTGWAAYDSSESTHKELGKKAGEENRLNKIGIYSEVCTKSTNGKCSIKGKYDDGRGTRLYSFEGCIGYDNLVVNLARGDKWFCTEEEAQKAGFALSGNCHRKN